MNPEHEKLWQKAVAFHGHACPGLAIGVRIAIDFKNTLNISDRAEDEELAAIIETDACGVDGVQFILGCTAGKGNLWLHKRGKHVFTLYQKSTEKGLRYYWHGSRQDHPDRKEKIEYFLNGPKEDLYSVSPARYPLPSNASLYPSTNCEKCGEYTAEPCIRLRDGKLICLDCAGFPIDLSSRIVL